MIQIDVINTIAPGVVGWKQTSRTGSPVVNAANLLSSSGLYYQFGSGLCTVDNIKACIDDEAISDANLNTYLSDLVKSALSDVCARVFAEDDHIDTGLLLKFENKFSETLTNATDFVGFEIDLSKRNDLSVLINSLITEFDASGTVKLLLFNSQVNAAIKSQSITLTANTAVHTTPTTSWTLNDLQYGGKWYIGYLRGSLTPKAIKRNYQMASVMTLFPEMGIRPIRVPDWNAETMFDPSDIHYEADTWGLNLNLSLYKDFTYIVKSNINRFAKALQLQVCMNVVDLISNTVRSNKAERLSKNAAILELNGNRTNPNFPEHAGLVAKLGKEIAALRSTYNPKGIIRATL